MIVIRAGIMYNGFLITKVSSNGWCRGFWPDNIGAGELPMPKFCSRQAKDLVKNQEYKLVPSRVMC